MAQSNAHRDLNKRQHRLVAAYLALRAWQEGADVVVLSRNALVSFFGVSRFEATRKKWMCDDMRPWFPHAEVLSYVGPADKFACIYLSRVPLTDAFPKGSMSDAQRLKGLEAAGVRGMKVGKLPTEEQIVVVMSKIATGLSDLADLGKA